MYSHKHFKPGGKTSTSKLIYYVAELNYLTGVYRDCYCIPDKYDKNTLGSLASSMPTSYASRLSQIVTSTKGGRVQYGNSYLEQPINVNYLGRTEGMPGGSGAPPLNKF
jgi:hypothetical protein